MTDEILCCSDIHKDISKKARRREREAIADWLEGWAEGYTDWGEEPPYGKELQHALKTFAQDIREKQHYG